MNQTTKTRPRLLKICGITRSEDLISCGENNVDFVGFNFSKQSPRALTPAQARQIFLEAKSISKSTSSCKIVAVFVDPSFAEVQEAIKDFPEIDTLQFHGNESLEFLKNVKGLVAQKNMNIAIWKALRISSEKDVAEAKNYDVHVDGILFDGPMPGSGLKFDWELLRGYKAAGFWGLAGGVKIDNLTKALELGSTFIDVCSGAEASPRIKDARKIALLKAAMS